MENIRLPAIGSAVFLTGTTAFLYCASTAYVGGYLGMLKLDAAVLDRNFHQVLYTGLLVSFVPATRLLAVAFLLCILYSATVFGLLHAYLKKGVRQKRRLLALKHALGPGLHSSRRERAMRARSLQVLGCALLVLALVLTLAGFERKGRRAAQEMLRRVASAGPLATEVVRVRIEDRPRSLIHLICGARNCAGLELASRTVYYYPQNGHSFQYGAAPVEVGR